jgi:hypothetical protein
LFGTGCRLLLGTGCRLAGGIRRILLSDHIKKGLDSFQSRIGAFEEIFGQISLKMFRFSPELWDISPNFSPNTLYVLGVCTCKYKKLKYKIQRY